MYYPRPSRWLDRGIRQSVSGIKQTLIRLTIKSQYRLFNCQDFANPVTFKCHFYRKIKENLPIWLKFGPLHFGSVESIITDMTAKSCMSHL